MRFRSFLMGLFLLLSATTVSAQTVVLIPGYLGTGAEWRNSGIATALYRAGWADAGQLTPGPYGQVYRLGMKTKASKRFLTVALPTEAPVMVQADLLARYVKAIEDVHPNEPVILVGYSAGGVVARAYMVKFRNPKVKALITIAAPNLGTPLATLGLAIGQSPLGWFTPFFGASTINRSQQLYWELAPERPGNFLWWLNRAPTPQAHYYSIIENGGGACSVGGDGVSSAFQQDLNNVIALRGRAKSIVMPGCHDLYPALGPVLVNILRQMGY